MKNIMTAIVTGGAQGIGRVIAQTLAGSGYLVTAADIDAEAVSECHRESVNSGVTFTVCDITDEDAIRRLVGQIVQKYGRINLVVNNAAIAANKKMEELTRAQWEGVLAVNLTAPFLMAKHCGKYLRAAKGSIINIGSTRALMSEPDTEAYSASKGGIVALTHAMAMSFAPDVRVNAVSPGWIEVSDIRKSSARKEVTLSDADHAQHPTGRVGQAEDIAEMVCYLASDKCGFITGQNFVIDGGMTKKMIYV
jgi:NAD(P)-dependent dehydrogenase (short-subunit alcohol dehydrogenase family)